MMKSKKTTNRKKRAAPSEPECVIGIDGGGSHTTAWVADGHHRILAKATAGPSNPLKVGLALAQHNLLAVSDRARREAGLRSGEDFAALCAGIAGIGRPAMHRQMLRRLKRSIPSRCYLLTHDAAIALEAAFGEAEGVVVIAGTGSIAFGRGAGGRILRCGGWGSVFGDLGSGYDIARKSVSAALAAADGYAPRTRLDKDICRALKIRRIADVVTLNLAPNQVAALLPLVLRAARAGDRVARRLCSDAGRDLAQIAAFLLARSGASSARRRVACSGGVFQASPEIRRSFTRAVHSVFPEAKIGLLRHPPVEGALRLARAISKNPQGRQAR